MHKVTAKLYGNAQGLQRDIHFSFPNKKNRIVIMYHHKIDQGDCIEGDSPPIHETTKVGDDHHNCDQHYQRAEDVQPHEDEGDYENGAY